LHYVSANKLQHRNALSVGLDKQSPARNRHPNLYCHFVMIKKLTLLTLGGLAIATAQPAAQAQNIVFDAPTGSLTSGADITWYYESATETWHTVFRAKGTAGQPTTTNVSGLTNPYAGFTGIVGNQQPAVAGDTGDYLFDTLTLNINTTTQVTVGATNYFIASASGSPLLGSGFTPDLGIRTRLRENEVALGTGPNTAANQFDSFNLTLNLGLSTFNNVALNTLGSPNVSLLFWDAFDDPDPLIDTATNTLTGNFSNYAHVHRNWGFSEYGTYDLVFDIQGVGGTYGATAPIGQTSITFNVVPEPGTGLLLLVGLGAAALVRRRQNPSRLS